MEAGTTDPAFPFGVVSLAGGTSEGHGENMGAFRLAQTGGFGILPNERLPETFVAQAFDAGEPWADEQSKCARPYDSSSPWACRPGRIGAPYTPMFMGGIHPRPKHVVGQRLASAARALVYGDKDMLWTGPVIKGCKVVSEPHSPFPVDLWIDIEFDETLLRGDAAFAFHTNVAFANPLEPEGGYYDGVLNESPMEVQLDGNKWVSVAILATSDREHLDPEKLIDGDVHLPPNYNVITVAAPRNHSAQITGIRYAWGDNPCCPRVSNTLIPCPPNSCPLGTINSSLPVVPFYARIVQGSCACSSPQVCSRPETRSSFV